MKISARKSFSQCILRLKKLTAFDDDISKLTFEKLTAFKITGKLSYLREIFTDKDKITEILPLGENEIYCDLGAYTGDTAEELISRTGGKYERIYALEPERKLQKCLKNLKANDNISLYNAAAWSIDTELYFAGGAGRQGRVDAAGKSSCKKSDSVLAGKNAPI